MMNSQPPFTIRPARPDEAGVILPCLDLVALFARYCYDAGNVPKTGTLPS